MNVAAILAGGTGTRMGNMEKPKQYLPLGKKPIILFAVEKFYFMPEFEKIIVLCPSAWLQTTKDILHSRFGESDRIEVLKGGASRNDTIMNAIEYIEANFETNEDTVLMTHDSVRPFVTYRIIKDNLAAMEHYDACDTVIAATDTIVKSASGKSIDEIPLRSEMYQGQTPQTFKVKTFKKLYETLDDQERSTLTDACKIFVLKKQPVALVKGETYNIKITYPSDLKMASALLGMDS